MGIATTADVVLQGNVDAHLPRALARPLGGARQVKAGSEEALVEILDEVGNPDGCTWSVYRGPLFLEFSLPLRFEVRERRTCRPDPARGHFGGGRLGIA